MCGGDKSYRSGVEGLLSLLAPRHLRAFEKHMDYMLKIGEKVFEGWVSSIVRRQAQNLTPLAQRAGHELYVLGQDGLAR